MKSLWNDADAASWREGALTHPADRALAERIYSSRLIGADPDLVLHGGGNTSVKSVRNIEGKGECPVIHVKGSGWDLDSIEAPGMPALELAPLLAARNGPPLSDPDMVALLRRNLLDKSAPNPSVETLLHAFLPAAVVDHTHALAVLALANQPDAAEICRRVYGDRLAIVPYVMPGFDLFIEGAKCFDANSACEGLFLVNHGLFTFAETARESYERMIAFVTMAEAELERKGAVIPADLPNRGHTAQSERLADELSASLVAAGGVFAGGVSLDFRSDANIDAYLAIPNLVDVATRGTMTPDHVIRIKPFPLLLQPDDGPEAISGALVTFGQSYREYFERNARRASEAKTMLDTLPRVALVRGLGLFGIGRNTKEAKVAADLAVQTARGVHATERYGRFQPLAEPDLFDMEYWSLEQAKLKS